MHENALITAACWLGEARNAGFISCYAVIGVVRFSLFWVFWEEVWLLSSRLISMRGAGTEFAIYSNRVLRRFGAETAVSYV